MSVRALFLRGPLHGNVMELAELRDTFELRLMGEVDFLKEPEASLEAVEAVESVTVLYKKGTALTSGGGVIHVYFLEGLSNVELLALVQEFLA